LSSGSTLDPFDLIAGTAAIPPIHLAATANCVRQAIPRRTRNDNGINDASEKNFV